MKTFCYLGEGNFGQVHKARANGIIPGDETRNVVAVKTLKGQLMTACMRHAHL